MRTIRATVALAVALTASVWMFFNQRDARINELSAKVDQLEQQRKRLADYARRISATRRVAQVDVLEQSFSPGGETLSTLRFQEIKPDGSLDEPVYRRVVGDLVYFEAAVLKFDFDRVGEDETEQTTSVAMFRRIFGDHQVAALAPNLNEMDDEAEQAARGVRGSNPDRVGSVKQDGIIKSTLVFGEGQTTSGARDREGSGAVGHAVSASGPEQTEFWNMFWDFMDDPGLAAHYGVRVAQIEAPAIAPRAGQTWKVTLDAAGGLNLTLLEKADGNRAGKAPATLAASKGDG